MQFSTVKIEILINTIIIHLVFWIDIYLSFSDIVNKSNKVINIY